MKYVFSLDLKVDLFKMSNASLVEDEIDDHSTGKWTKRQYLYEFVFGVTFCLTNERFLSGCTLLDLFQFFHITIFVNIPNRLAIIRSWQNESLVKFKQNIWVLDNRNNSDKTKKFIALFVMLRLYIISLCQITVKSAGLLLIYNKSK